jgi:dUTP pyrophosphatase
MLTVLYVVLVILAYSVGRTLLYHRRSLVRQRKLLTTIIETVDMLTLILSKHMDFHDAPEGIVKLKSGKLTKSEPRAAGYDIHADDNMIVHPGDSVIVATGVTTEMIGCDALILDKSGLAAKFRMTRRAGVIDETYPKEWGVVMVNEGRETFHIKQGDKLANVIFIPKFDIRVVAEGGEVIVHEQQRTGGFGSTGA